jgi:hypothetical protein
MKRSDGDRQPDDRGDRGTGGESACLAHLLCPECGAVLDGGPHREGCSLAEESGARGAGPRPTSEA